MGSPVISWVMRMFSYATHLIRLACIDTDLWLFKYLAAKRLLLSLCRSKIALITYYAGIFSIHSDGQLNFRSLGVVSQEFF